MATQERLWQGGKKIIAGSFGLFSVLGPRQTDRLISFIGLLTKQMGSNDRIRKGKGG